MFGIAQNFGACVAVSGEKNDTVSGYTSRLARRPLTLNLERTFKSDTYTTGN